MFKRMLLVVSMALLAACGPETNQEACEGGGDEIVVDGTAVCVYDTRQSGIIETGFSCPAGRANQTEYGDLVVCSDGAPPDGIEDELEERYPDADLGDDPCANVVCDAGQTCVDGTCEADSNNGNNTTNNTTNNDVCEPVQEICNDGEDNDCDGLSDCEDDDCAADPSCVPGCQDPYEPNDTTGEATDFETDGPTDSELCGADDVDYWTTGGLAAGDRMTVWVTLPAQADVTVRLVDSNGEKVFGEATDFIEFDSNTIMDGMFGGGGVVRRGQEGPFFLEIRGAAATDYQVEFTTQTVPRLGGIAEIGAGSGFTCARDDAGQVYCWGDNTNNQLGTAGDGSNTPIEIDSNLTASSLAVGPEHSCAQMSDDQVWCWGANQLGELGTDTGGAPSTPVASGVTGPVDEIGVGRDFTCARTGGSVQCWGDNTHGQLGDPTFVDATSTTPITVVDIDDAQELAVGATHACVRRANDEVWCWGDNRDDQLSDPMDVFDDYSAQPLAINPSGGLPEPLSGIGLSAAGNWTVAHQSDGHGLGFGNLPNFDEGNGAGVLLEIPIAMFNNPSPDATATIAGPQAWCRIENDGRVACMGEGPWERNPLHLGGNDVALYQDGGVYGIYVKDLVDPRDVSIGADHMCAVENGGDAVCWGFNDNGQLGIGTTNSSTWAAYVRAAN